MRIRANSIAIVVRDRRKAAKWYIEKLGFREVGKDDGHWTVVIAPGDALRFHLCEYRGGKGPTATEADTGIRLTVDRTIPEAYRALSRRGVKFEAPPKETEWGWDCRLLDRDGNRFWLVPNRR